MGDELEVLRWLRSRLHGGPGVQVGMGDDAAVLDAAGRGALVTACDQVLEGVHFAADTPARAVGHKALARNLSDLAAMGARPWVALSAVAWPPSRDTRSLQELFEGLLECARQNDTTLVGGDLGRCPEGVRVDVTVIGCMEGRRPMLRRGARVGDLLVVSGELGGSREGHHLHFTPRWREGIALSGLEAVHAAIDLSDGLASDLPHLLEAEGLGARIDTSRLPRRRLADGSRASVEAALRDGEDFELLVALHPSAWPELPRKPGLADVPWSCIGEITRHGLELVDPDGRVTPLVGGGYEHRFA